MVVYVDVFFALNFCMDFVILLTVRKISKSEAGIIRSVLAAISGAIYACFVLMVNMGGGIFESVITYIVMSILMAIIAYGYSDLQGLIENVATIFIVTFILSGIINQIYFRGVINGAIGIVAIAVVGCGIIVGLFTYAKKKSSKANVLVKTLIVKGNNRVEVKALIDTGNCLREPISRKPVAVVSREVVDMLKEGDDGVYVIPFRSVGMERGMLMGFTADYMEISKEKKGKIKIVKVIKPILAEYAGKFTENNHYQMLLHPEMMGEGEDYV